MSSEMKQNGVLARRQQHGHSLLNLFFFIAGAIGFIYYFWICFKLKLVGWAIAGIVFPVAPPLIGIWSLLFGVPGFMLPDNF